MSYPTYVSIWDAHADLDENQYIDQQGNVIDCEEMEYLTAGVGINIDGDQVPATRYAIGGDESIWLDEWMQEVLDGEEV